MLEVHGRFKVQFVRLAVLGHTVRHRIIHQPKHKALFHVLAADLHRATLVVQQQVIYPILFAHHSVNAEIHGLRINQRIGVHDSDRLTIFARLLNRGDALGQHADHPHWVQRLDLWDDVLKVVGQAPEMVDALADIVSEARSVFDVTSGFTWS